MFKVGDKVIIKTLQQMVDEGYMKKCKDLEDVYRNENANFVLFPDFNFYDLKTTIEEVDNKDAVIPYYLECGIWVPEFMIKEEELIQVVANDINVIVGQPKYINKFNNKPFGPLLLKLIAIDEKIAEFSNTAFTKLKKHELQYIAKLFIDRGEENIDYNKMTQKELSTWCYAKALNLDD